MTTWDLTPGGTKALIGMVHVGALPGTPFHQQPIDDLVRTAVDDARLLADAGYDALIVENMHDRPYVQGLQGPEIVATMTRVGLAVREAASIPLGIQILSCGNREALAVAHAIGASFIRCENFVLAHIGEEGIMAESEAAELLRYRRRIGAEDVKIYADIKKKHASHTITADLSIGEAAHLAEFAGADGAVVTGTMTGSPTNPSDVESVREATELPLLVGSGVTPDDIGKLLDPADAVIVGSWNKAGGKWTNPVDPERAKAMVDAFRKATIR